MHVNLLGRGFYFHLAAEPPRPGEDEVVAARCLFDRVAAASPRAFGVAAYIAAGLDPSRKRDNASSSVSM